MSDPVRVAIIGCGVISHTHAESFARLAGADLVAACDLIPERAKALAEKFNIPRTCTDYRELLDDDAVDLISICTDHASHPAIACAAFEAGKHVLCEKALAANEHGLQQMLDAHAAHPKQVFAGVFQHRFDAAVQTTRQLVEEGTLGKLLTVGMKLRCHRPDEYYGDGWHGTWAYEGGSVLINQAIHFVDAAAWIAGGAASIQAQWDNLAHPGVMETEDTLVAALRYRCGALGTFTATCGSHDNWHHLLSFEGDRGTIELQNGRPAAMLFADNDTASRAKRRFDQTSDPDGVAAARSYYGTGHAALIADVIDAIGEGREPFVTGEQAAHALRIVLSAYASARDNVAVDIPADALHDGATIEATLD